VQRTDRDLSLGVVPEQKQDDRDETVRSIKEYLKRPILAGELNGKVPLHSGALRKYADLDSTPEHEMVVIRRRLREERASA